LPNADEERGPGSNTMTKPSANEFLPLPYFPWTSRPETLPLSIDEIETALFLDQGHLDKAAARLKVTEKRLKRSIRGTPRLQLLIERLRPQISSHR
jgi:hypothetical protein